ncbi:hypothetical protein U1Q18_019091 [Sarracenia purpurea var. burkii]
MKESHRFHSAKQRNLGIPSHHFLLLDLKLRLKLWISTVGDESNVTNLSVSILFPRVSARDGDRPGIPTPPLPPGSSPDYFLFISVESSIDMFTTDGLIEG